MYGAYAARIGKVLAVKRIRVRHKREGVEGTDLLVETVPHRGAHA